MTSRCFRLLLTGAACGIAAWAHYTWILTPDAAPLAVGQAATLQIGHGHHFPASEEAIHAGQLDLFVLTPSAARVKLAPAVSKSAVTASYTPREPGVYRIAMVQDRGIRSRTPQGVKPGGRDRNPNATQASRTLRTAVAYVSAGRGAVAAPPRVGLEAELTGELAQGVWRLRLWQLGKPRAGVSVEVFLAGTGKAADAGQTGPDGGLTYRLPAAAKGPALFSATWREPAPPGAPFDFVNYETSLTASW
jgi:hypothetical protein